MEEKGDLTETWQNAKDFIGERIARAAVTHRSEAYTVQEQQLRERGVEVRTGLKKEMKMGDESESDEDEDEDEDMEDIDGGGEEGQKGNAATKKFDGPARSLDDIVRFMTTGLTPEDDSQLSSGMFFRK